MNQSIGVLFTVEWALYLKQLGYKNITLITDKYDQKVDIFASKVILCPYKLLSEIEEQNMKFDVVVGNPPYQLKVGPDKTEPIWQKFVQTSFNIVKDDGYVSLIHPSGWRSARGRFSATKDILTQNYMHYLSMNGYEDGMKMFNVATNFDWYVCQKTSNVSGTTQVNTISGDNVRVLLNDFPFVPSGMFDEFSKLIAKDGEETVTVLYDRTAYGTDKKNMSKEHTEVNVYPCVYTITQKKGITCHYSSTNENGHFGIPKVIWSNGLGTYPFVDSTGEYGLTQFAYAIADTPENLENIARALNSEKFKELMVYSQTNEELKYNIKVIETFKKDFWKYFV
jgi:hypothetical protein